MLLVIAGAGASYDSLDKRDVAYWGQYQVARPPLASELFDPREGFAERLPPILRGLASELRAVLAGGGVLEEELEKLSTRDDDEARREVMAMRFYLQRVIVWCDNQSQTFGRAGTNYDALVRLLSMWTRDTGIFVSYATFNYDRFLERAFEVSAGQPLNDLDSYVRHPHRHLYKLHGSIGWVRQAIVQRSQSIRDEPYAIQNAPDLHLSPIVLPSDTHAIGEPIEVPAIAVPTRSKTKFECPDMHLEKLRGDLAEVDRLLVVGWRGAEDHFLGTLAESLPKTRIAVLVANGVETDCMECFERLRTALNAGGRHVESVMPWSHGGQPGSGGRLRFSDLVASPLLENFLALA